MLVELDKDEEHLPIAEVADFLPESVPRFICYSYKQVWRDGRTSYPVCFIYYCPREIQPNLAMMYTATKNTVCTKFEIMKSFDLEEAELLNEDWLKEKLGFFDRSGTEKIVFN